MILRSRFVDNIKRDIRKIPLAEIPLRIPDSADNRLFGVDNFVMFLVFRYNALGNPDSIIKIRLPDLNFLKTPVKSLVLFEMLGVLVLGSSPNQTNLPSGQGRLDKVAGIHPTTASGSGDAGVSHR